MTTIEFALTGVYTIGGALLSSFLAALTLGGRTPFLKLLAWGAAVCFALWAVIWCASDFTRERLIAAAVTVVIVSLGLALLIIWTGKVPPSATAELRGLGVGGRGGDAKVGGSGSAIGGRGGSAGSSGRGGDGGSAEVSGDGHAAGGEGGSASEPGVWKPPARSGYETSMRAQGLPVDPTMKRYGRGGTDPEYYTKLRTIYALRGDESGEALDDFGLDPECQKDVSLDDLNRRLGERGYIWRVRVADGQYEFFLPGA